MSHALAAVQAVHQGSGRVHRSLHMRAVRAAVGAWLLLAVPGCASESAPADTTPDTTGDTVSADVAGSLAVFEEARRRGVDFRGVGQEPGWTVDIDTDRGGTIDFTGEYGAIRVIEARLQAVTEEEGARVYEVRTDNQTLRVRIEMKACEDTMSGEVFSHAVQVEMDGRRLHGCGRVIGTWP